MDGNKGEHKQIPTLEPRDLLEIINGSKSITNENFPSFTEAFEHETSFRQMFNFVKMHKEMAYNSDIPHSSCLCEVCKNVSLLAKGINSGLKSSDISSSTHDLVETHTCDLSSKDCKLENYPECLKPSFKLSFKLSLSDFQSRCMFNLPFTMAAVTKKGRQS